MFKKYSVLLLFLLGGGAALCGGLQEGALAGPFRHAALAGSKRFSYLRFYKPSLKMPQPLNMWERWFTSQEKEEHQRALAVYLFNMYVTARSYQQTQFQTLDLNTLGVLDGFMRCHKPFDFQHATQFYRQNKHEVQALLNEFLHARSLPWPAPTEAEATAWLTLLERQPQRHGQPVYTGPRYALLGGVVIAPFVKVQLTPLLAQAVQAGRRQVVLYDESATTLEDLDAHIGPKPARRKRTYRWVADECNYMSYLVARQLTANVLQQPQNWGAVRIYTLTAYPARGEFLTPAQGARFKLADGRDSLQWRYHTVVLAVVPYPGAYTPVVLDHFLGGTEPLPLQAWLSHFAQDTVFTAVPFWRSETVENALTTPQRLDGANIWAKGQLYTPAPVLK